MASDKLVLTRALLTGETAIVTSFVNKTEESLKSLLWMVKHPSSSYGRKNRDQNMVQYNQIKDTLEHFSNIWSQLEPGEAWTMYLGIKDQLNSFNLLMLNKQVQSMSSRQKRLVKNVKKCRVKSGRPSKNSKSAKPKRKGSKTSKPKGGAPAGQIGGLSAQLPAGKGGKKPASTAKRAPQRASKSASKTKSAPKPGWATAEEDGY